MTSETRTFSLHPNAIYTFIRAQAGSLAKALTESVMNSIDASANLVEVTLTNSGFVVQDDGTGFLSKAEIAAWFDTLGFPHDEGNHRIFGAFGLGRAQAFSYASTVWTTNQFRMEVDVKKTGLDYVLTEISPPQPGTRIVGTFYSPLDASGVLRTIADLEQALRYAPSIVMVNGKVINKDPASEAWTLETDDAYFRIAPDKKSGLMLYNVGVFAQHVPYYSSKLTADIVTKPGRAFQLNMARNEVLQAECPVWQRVLKALAPYRDVPKATPTRKKLTAEEVEALYAAFREGDLTLPQLLTKYPMALPSVLQRPVPWYDIASMYRPRRVTVAPKTDTVAKRIHKRRDAIILEKSCLLRLGFRDVQELRDLVDTQLAKDVTDSRMREVYAAWKAVPWSNNAPDMFVEEYAGYALVPVTELTPTERCAFDAWQRSWAGFEPQLKKAAQLAGLPWEKSMPRPSFGEGRDGVWMNAAGPVFRRDFAAKLLTRSAGRAAQDLLAILRQLCGAYVDSLKAESAPVTVTGDEFFMVAATQTPIVGETVPALLSRYAYACRSRDIPLPAPLTAALAAFEDPDA